MYVGNISMEKKNELLSIILLPNPFEIFAPLNKGNMLSCKGGGECYGKCIWWMNKSNGIAINSDLS